MLCLTAFSKVSDDAPVHGEFIKRTIEGRTRRPFERNGGRVPESNREQTDGDERPESQSKHGPLIRTQGRLRAKH